jgi:hypothetical protein
VFDDLQFDFLVEESFELCCDFFVEIQVGDFEKSNNLVLTHLLTSLMELFSLSQESFLRRCSERMKFQPKMSIKEMT